MHSTTIKIDGAKLRDLLENRTNKTIYQIAQESGYSKNVISNAIKKGYASSAVQNIARLYDITPDDYKVIETDPEPVEELKGQISIDDIESIKRDELKALVKEAVIEALRSFGYVRVSGIDYDPKNKRFKLFVNEEDLK
jgi:hypothetical protein